MKICQWNEKQNWFSELSFFVFSNFLNLHVFDVILEIVMRPWNDALSCILILRFGNLQGRHCFEETYQHVTAISKKSFFSLGTFERLLNNSVHRESVV